MLLVIEPNRDNRIIINHVVQKFQQLYLFPKTAREAICLAEKHLPEPIILEINLPSLSGLSLINNLKMRANTQNIPILVLTSFADSSIRKKTENAGCDAYVVKPYLLEVLENKISHFLNKKNHKWWVEIKTAIPECIYYFGPFDSQGEAKSHRSDYLEDLVKEKAVNITTKIKQTHPTHLTIEQANILQV